MSDRSTHVALLGLLRRGKAIVARMTVLIMAFVLGKTVDSSRYRIADGVVKLISRTPLHRWVVPFWSMFLRRQGGQFANLDWLRFAAQELDKPPYHYAYFAACDELRVPFYKELEAYIGRWKFAIQPASNNKNFHNLRVVALLDQIGASDQVSRLFAGDNPLFHSRSYARLWMAHTATDAAGVQENLLQHAEAVRWDPDLMLQIANSVLLPGAYHHITKSVMEQTSIKLSKKRQGVSLDKTLTVRERNTQLKQLDETLRTLRNVRRMALVELGESLGEDWSDLSDTEYLDEDTIEDYYWAAMDARTAGLGDLFVERMETYVRYSPSYGGENTAKAHSHLAVHYETQRDFDRAKAHYEHGYTLEGVPFYLPDSSWRYITFLMATGAWNDAASLLIEGHRKLWPIYASVTKSDYAKLLRQPKGLLRPRGALVLGCQGLGDELIRICMMARFVHLDRHFGITCDPRMVPIYQRSFPGVTIVAPKRLTGPEAVTYTEYLKDREGVPAGMDVSRINSEVLRKSKRFRDVMPSEDIFLHFVRVQGELPKAGSEPTLKVSAQDVAAAREWLDQLPGNLTVGVSWRSGVRDKTRNEYYIDAMELGAIWGLENVSFVSLQYSDTAEEEAEILQAFGCKLMKMPGVDLKNDIDRIAALAKSCDIVISISTTLRELAGACGARVISMSTTPVMPDIWRIADDGETDTLFPNMTHVTNYRYGSKAAVIDEVAVRLRNMSAAADAKSGELVSVNG